MRLFRYLFICVSLSLFSAVAFAQLDSVWHQGPAAGSVSSGVMVTLSQNTFHPESPSDSRIMEENKIEPNFGQMIINADESTLPPYVYTEDANATDKPLGTNGQTVLLNKFKSISMTNSIPPDPHVAVGPNHIIACVNTAFAVYDKQGNQLAFLSADSWISPVISSGAFDPQILYDHYLGRWFMLWDWQDNASQQAYFIISYSDDDNPLGTWYMYLMDAKVNGTSSSGTWGDYPQIGYDENAIYINSRSFTFAGFYQYNRLRILDKNQLYASNGGQVNWSDIWNIRTPGQGSGGQALDVIHPVYSYTPGSGSYFFWANRSGANYYCVFQILNPLSTSPRIRGKVLSTQFYGQAPNANQLGGGALLIETNGSHIKTQPVLRDGKIFFAHSIRNTVNATYCSAKYGIYDIGTETITEQVEQGAVGYFYFYPTIAVDQDQNIAITYSRSADDEYAGAFYTSKQASAPPGLEPSQPIQVGLGNYVVDFGSGRNRWGDYLGICVDPSNFYNVFMLGEYAASTNQWGTYIAEVRMVPFSGQYSKVFPKDSHFEDTEVNFSSTPIPIVITNYGTDDVTINGIDQSVGPFIRTSNNTFPIVLSSYDSITVEVTFSPEAAGDFDETLLINSDDPNLTGLHLQGHSYDMLQAYTGFFYASSGSQNNGDILTVDKSNGNGTLLGTSGYSEISKLSVNPNSNILFGLYSTAAYSSIARVNAGAGDAYELYNLDLGNLYGFAFNAAGNLYVANQEGLVYTINLSNGTYTFVDTIMVNDSTSLAINAFAFDPQDGDLWVAKRVIVGLGKDEVYKVDTSTWTATLVGNTGFNVLTNDLAFDEVGNLYGVYGTTTQNGKFFQIDKSTGAGTVVGTDIGFKHITGLGYSLNGPIINVNDEIKSIPSNYSLYQNYPNPFNPSTKIEFALPVQANVQLTIYNLLGQRVISLYDGQLQAGSHSFTWNADDVNGKKLSSGIYFYELKAKGSNGTDFQNTKKMLLLK